ncbi:MMPL family transporter [Saccharothrix sp. ST-888]|uniref:MMPL family transporter n=1 Tax=Saccharothrix sp. ST-888 TaxID=1427391 RepID=UPI0007C7DE57|nr:MMPL family transporter [Saccharothrix sp. ST-888]
MAAWLLLLAAAAVAVGVFGRVTTDAVTIPGSDSQAASDAARAFPGSASGRQPVVLHTAADAPQLTSADATKAVEAAARAIAEVAHVVAVTTPYDPAGRAAMSPDGHTAYLSVELDVTGRDITPGITRNIVAAARPAATAGIEVTPGGYLAAAVDKGSTGHSEAIGLTTAFVILAVSFGSLLAAGVPLLAGAVGLGISLPALGLVGHLVDMPDSGETIAAMVGLGVGIDYGLFCLTRFRELRAAGVGIEDAAVRTMAGSGKAVAFAGSAVVAALTGLALGGLPLLYALALAPGMAVLTAMAVTLTLLPAGLVLLGRRLTPKTAAGAQAGGEPAGRVATATPAGGVGPDGEPAGTATAGLGSRNRPRGWARIAEQVAARPWRSLLAALALVAVLAAPATDLTFGQLDAGDNAVGTASRTAYDRLSAAFGPGVNGTLQVVDTLPSPASGSADTRIAAVGKALRSTPGVAAVGQAQLSSDGTHVRWQVTPATAPSDPATAALVHRLRDTTLPRATAGTGQSAHVGGTPAGQADLNQRLAHRLPLIVGFVLAVAALLLLLAFRSPVVAVKAALMNLLSVAAAYGILTAVFQWGWGAALIGLDGAVPIPGYVPLLMFAVLFGLSMDYEVFLLTAVRGAYLRGGDNRRAVVDGLAGTGRIITSAALIMVSVFLSYLLSDDPVVKMFGIGLAAAVALDATVVRGVLVPAGMILLGDRNWWLPGLLDRLLPHVDIEGDGHPDASPTGSSDPAGSEDPAESEERELRGPLPADHSAGA